MKLDDNYFITRDKYNVVLNYREEKGLNADTGKITISTDEWYYGNMKDALKAYLNKSGVHNESVDDVIAHIQRVEHKIDNLKEI